MRTTRCSLAACESPYPCRSGTRARAHILPTILPRVPGARPARSTRPEHLKPSPSASRTKYADDGFVIQTMLSSSVEQCVPLHVPRLLRRVMYIARSGRVTFPTCRRDTHPACPDQGMQINASRTSVCRRVSHHASLDPVVYTHAPTGSRLPCTLLIIQSIDF